MNMMFDSMLKCFLCFIMMLLPISVISQVQKNGSSLYPTLESQREPLYTEIRTLHHSSEDSMTILAMFRIQYDALLFEKSTSFRGAYVAFPSLEIESKDSNGIIKSRIQWKDSVFASSYEQTNSESLYAYGLRAITVLKTQYAVMIALMDKGQIIKKVRMPVRIYSMVIFHFLPKNNMLCSNFHQKSRTIPLHSYGLEQMKNMQNM
jgi:hypothetical protein